MYWHFNHYIGGASWHTSCTVITVCSHLPPQCVARDLNLRPNDILKEQKCVA